MSDDTPEIPPLLSVTIPAGALKVDDTIRLFVVNGELTWELVPPTATAGVYPPTMHHTDYHEP